MPFFIFRDTNATRTACFRVERQRTLFQARFSELLSTRLIGGIPEVPAPFGSPLVYPFGLGVPLFIRHGPDGVLAGIGA
jgi:hypothetical protein